MKSLILISLLSFANLSNANTVDSAFKKDSKVPTLLQERILEELNARCGKVISDYGLNEIETTVKKDYIDQGVIDLFYTTTFSSRYYFDGTHPITMYITVESAEYAFSNGDNLSVLKIDADGLCK